MMNEEDIRAKAHKRNDGGRDPQNPSRDKFYNAKKSSRLLGDPLFRDKVALYVDDIPLNPIELKHCQACEGVLCGLCGKCHDLDRKNWHTDPACPNAQHMHQSDACVAWVYAYRFLQDADKQAEKERA